MTEFSFKKSDLNIESLGKAKYESHLSQGFVKDSQRVLLKSNHDESRGAICTDGMLSFEKAGPREKLFFDSKDLVCGIVTCGGLCPGLNDVIRAVTLSLLWEYKAKKVLGFRYGYRGVSSTAFVPPIELTPEVVSEIQHEGGTILGSSRGPQDAADIAEILQKYNVKVLFVIGGDGTFRGAHELSEYIEENKLGISIVGIPKTIDNDIYCSERTFGFSTAVEEAQRAICSAHKESRAAWNGIGIVKLMGRDSGFIAAAATLANSDVNFCLIPEVPFSLEGEDGILSKIKERLEEKRHLVIVVAEGAGQHLMSKVHETDLSGNRRYRDIGLFLKAEIREYYRKLGEPVTIKFIDPSYMIRSCPANADDSSFCLMLSQHAVHAAMAGKTDMFVGYWHNSFVHVPLNIAARKKKQLNLNTDLWRAVKEIMD